MKGCEYTFKMRRKTDFKQMFLVDSTLYKKLNTTTPSPPLAVPEIPTPLPETPPSEESKEKSVDETKKTSTHKDFDDKQKPKDEMFFDASDQTKDEKFFDATDPIVKALKEHHEHSVESTEPPIKKPRYENNDNELDFKQMIKEIDDEIKNWNELRKDAIKMHNKVGRKRKQPRYAHYFAD